MVKNDLNLGKTYLTQIALFLGCLLFSPVSSATLLQKDQPRKYDQHPLPGLPVELRLAIYDHLGFLDLAHLRVSKLFHTEIQAIDYAPSISISTKAELDKIGEIVHGFKTMILQTKRSSGRLQRVKEITLSEIQNCLNHPKLNLLENLEISYKDNHGQGLPIELFARLKELKRLSRISLSTGDLTVNDIGNLDAAFEEKSLKNLSLFYNGLTGSKIEALAQLLEHHRELETLDVSLNPIKLEGFLLLFRALDAHTRITTLDFSVINFDRDTAIALIAFLDAHRSIQTVYLELNSESEPESEFLTPDAVTQIRAYLKTRPDLKIAKVDLD